MLPGTGYEGDLAAAVGRLHSVLWRRLVDPRTGVLLDYAGPDGEADIPTPDDCRACRPNALSWWTPIENGAFFNGLYLDALCTSWEVDRNPRTRDEARTIARGLFLLQDVGTRPGFIARGVSTDGKTHYPLGSSDQTFPWLYGLWRYLDCGMANEAEREEIIRRMDTVVRMVKGLGWRMPAEVPYEVAGEWLTDCFREVSRALFANRIMLELSGDPFWQESLDEVMGHVFPDGRGVVDVLLNVGQETPFHFTWINAASVAAVRDLGRLEENAELKATYRECLRRAGEAAAPYVPRWREFPGHEAPFNGDWRCMNAIQGRQETVADAVSLAVEQLKLWDTACPAVRLEKKYVMWPLFAAWIVLLSGDDDLIGPVLPEMCAAILSLDPDRLHYSACFVVENIYAELLRRRHATAV